MVLFLSLMVWILKLIYGILVLCFVFIFFKISDYNFNDNFCYGVIVCLLFVFVFYL